MQLPVNLDKSYKYLISQYQSILTIAEPASFELKLACIWPVFIFKLFNNTASKASPEAVVEFCIEYFIEYLGHHLI